MDIVNEYFEETIVEMKGLPSSMRMLEVRPKIVCGDGFRISVQASHTHYCTPRSDLGPYSAVELGYPSAEESDLVKWAEDKYSPTETVYGYVPVDVVVAVIEKHGGIDREATLGV